MHVAALTEKLLERILDNIKAVANTSFTKEGLALIDNISE